MKEKNEPMRTYTIEKIAQPAKDPLILDLEKETQIVGIVIVTRASKSENDSHLNDVIITMMKPFVPKEQVSKVKKYKREFRLFIFNPNTLNHSNVAIPTKDQLKFLCDYKHREGLNYYLFEVIKNGPSKEAEPDTLEITPETKELPPI